MKTILNIPWRKRHIQEKLLICAFILPVVVTLAALLLYPFAYGIYISFFNTNLVNKWKFVGFKNYLSVINASYFTNSLWVTVRFTTFVVIGHFFLGLLFAVLLNKDIPGRTVFRAILVLPWLFPVVVVSNIFKWILNSANGLFNAFLQTAGVIETPISFFGSAAYAMASLVFVCIWKGYPLVMIQLLGGMQSISADLYEAATIDGATKWKQFVHVTLPGLKPTIVVTLILDTVWWFKHVPLIYQLTAGGPGTSTNTISLEIYRRAFEYNKYGPAAAIATIVFIICLIISIVQKKVIRDD